MELVDTQDLKSCGQQCPYGFDSRPKHRAEAGRKASWFPVRLSSLYPTYPSRSIYLQSNRLNLIAVVAVTVVDMVVRSWLLRTWLLWTWLLGHGCSVMAVATESHHITISYHHIIPPHHIKLRPHTFYCCIHCHAHCCTHCRILSGLGHPTLHTPTVFMPRPPSPRFSGSSPA